jgi:hypothetical protein
MRSLEDSADLLGLAGQGTLTFRCSGEWLRACLVWEFCPQGMSKSGKAAAESSVSPRALCG